VKIDRGITAVIIGLCTPAIDFECPVEITDRLFPVLKPKKNDPAGNIGIGVFRVLVNRFIERLKRLFIMTRTEKLRPLFILVLRVQNQYPPY